MPPNSFKIYSAISYNYVYYFDQSRFFFDRVEIQSSAKSSARSSMNSQAVLSENIK